MYHDYEQAVKLAVVSTREFKNTGEQKKWNFKTKIVSLNRKKKSEYRITRQNERKKKRRIAITHAVSSEHVGSLKKTVELTFSTKIIPYSRISCQPVTSTLV